MTIPLELRGREAEARLPDFLSSTTRSADAASNVFLPPGYLVPRKCYDVGTAARSAEEGSAAQRHSADDDEVLVLELADGGILVTSAARLRETLQRTHPEAVAPDGTLLLEKLRADGAATRGSFGNAVGGLIRRVFSLVVGAQPDAISKEALADFGLDKALLGVSWLGTKALMRAIENHLPRGPGLYRWGGGDKLDEAALGQGDFDARWRADPGAFQMLVFVHGTASHTLGSFGDLKAGDRGGFWAELERQFPGGIYGFEHRTLSQSPIDNACELVDALPEGAHVSLVSHSRGGLVCDLFCLDDFAQRIPDYRYEFEGVGSAVENQATEVRRELDDAHAEHRQALATLAAQLAKKKPVVHRYVRVASPAAGTKLASGNFDLFLSSLLTLIGQVPFFFGSPFYAAFKRVVLEIAKNRTDPHLVPGIEAMLPDSPLARLLRDAPPRDGLQMAVIAGDIEGGGMLQRLGVLLTDFLFFDNTDNDLVVDTPAMLAGIATRANARVKFDRGGEVSHFRYFANTDTRAALRDWLMGDRVSDVTAFVELPTPLTFEAALQSAARSSRDVPAGQLPVVVVLPGVMGSHLAVRKVSKSESTATIDRVWFDPVDIAAGGLEKIEWKEDDQSVFAEELFSMFYGKLCEHLSKNHRVERFAYDWRQPLDVLAERFGEYLARLLAQTDQPIRLLAHGMGGLVVRACIHRRRPVMDELMARKGARLVMLGTPNQGAYSMVENLLGKGDTLRTLVRLDLKHDMQQVLNIVAGIRGALQLLPKPGFVDIFQGQSDGGNNGWAFEKAETWKGFVDLTEDLWFGNGKVGQPTQAALDSASWLWRQGEAKPPALPETYKKDSIYVFGAARNTPCGLRKEEKRLRMVGTTHGDGTVTWASGRIEGIGSYYYMPAEHGDLPATPEYFGALSDLLESGRTTQLMINPPAVRAIQQPQPVVYDAGPPGLDDADALQRKLVGGSLRNRVPPAPKRRLAVTIHAMDLRFLTQPILVGHYEHDPIAGPQATIDRELLNHELSERHNLGLYPGPLGTATAVLRVPNEIERQRGTLSGVVVVGLGAYDKPLTLATLTEAVRAGALRYLLQVIDVLGKGDRELPLAALLLGYNSSANLTVAASVEALVRGVMQANARFSATTGLKICIARLQIVELNIDTAISAVYALRDLTGRLTVEAQRLGTQLVCAAELNRGEGLRRRLLDNRGGSYWPRLIVTDADRSDVECPPECYATRCSPDRCAHPPCDCSRNITNTPGVPPGSASRALIADRLRFLYVGQRARAESVVQQRQPGLIEQLVRQQIYSSQWQPDFGRLLFQLMLPPDFKEPARQLERVVLVVDSYTANLPWELMLADDPVRTDSDGAPLGVRAAVVRQLVSTNFRPRVRQAIGNNALVIGNPSLDNFLQFFPGPTSRPNIAPPSLDGAEKEAEAVAAALRQFGFTVQPVIGSEQTASNVLQTVCRQSWRLLHISAHGVFDLRHIDGRNRSGVLLADGLLITAAEIEAMEIVPDLVFLSCCHSGKIDSLQVRDGNRLAASIARELIQIGVRCVIVAGWAVDDGKAKQFGLAFYEHLLQGGRAFGDAVFEARKAVWESDHTDLTWGAFQAYGDPDWRVDPRATNAHRSDDEQFASPDELFDTLTQIRVDFSRRTDQQSERERSIQVKSIDVILRKRCPSGWLKLPEIQSELGNTWRDLGEFDKARDAYLTALRAEDKSGGVPVRDIEQLANVEARLGERRAEQDLEGAPDAAAKAHRKGESPEDLIDRALLRLQQLDALVDGTTPERAAIRGSAYKRKASLYARRLLVGKLPANQKTATLKQLRAALACSTSAYRDGEGRPESRFSAYHALNRLAIESLTEPEAQGGTTPIEIARHSGKVSALAFAESLDPWKAVMQAEAVLVERLVDASFGAPAESGEVAFGAATRAYAEALESVMLKPSQLDSVIAQMELLSRFADALSLETVPTARRQALSRIADRLLGLVKRLQPDRRERTDRPERLAAPRPPPPATARKTTKRRVRSPKKPSRKT